jgi:hypothetical protein
VIIVHAMTLAVPLARLGVVGEVARVLDADWRAENMTGERYKKYVTVEVSSRVGLDRGQLQLLFSAADPEGQPQAAGPHCFRCNQSIVDDHWMLVEDQPHQGMTLVHKVCPVTAQPGVLNT